MSVSLADTLSRRAYEVTYETSIVTLFCIDLNNCYPAPNSNSVPETCVEVDLQVLVEHAVVRFVFYLSDMLEIMTSNELASLELVYKWGSGGSEQVI